MVAVWGMDICKHCQQPNENPYSRYLCKPCKNAKERAARASDPDFVARKRENLRRWREQNKARNGYIDQKANAKKRGIDFLFSYEEWLDWWGDDISRRFRRSEGLVMARYNDSGPYHPDNVFKQTLGDNSREANAASVPHHETLHTR